jgi:hypothetical protein
MDRHQAGALDRRRPGLAKSSSLTSFPTTLASTGLSV